MYCKESESATYEGVFGELFVEFSTGVVADGLDHHLIRLRKPHDQNEVYRHIGEMLLEDGEYGDDMPYVGMPQKDGSVVFGDGVNYKLVLGAEGVKLFQPDPQLAETGR